VEDHAMRHDDVRTEEIVVGQQVRSRLARRGDEQILVMAPGALSGEQVRDLGRALGDVSRDRQTEVGAGLVELDRDRVGSVGRDTGPYARGKHVRGAIANSGEMLERASRIGAKDLEIDSCSEAELPTGARARAAE